jgi:hypothetical protein
MRPTLPANALSLRPLAPVVYLDGHPLPDDSEWAIVDDDELVEAPATSTG